FRVERAEGGSVQDVLQRLKADLPLDAATSEITHGSSLASELQLKEALLKIETLEMAKTSFTDQLDAAQAKLKVLETSLTDSKTERTALTNQLASAQVKLKGLETTSTKSQTELTTKDSDITAINRQLTAKSDALSKAEKRVGELEALVPVSLTEGLCRPSQLTTLPPCAKAWVEENSSELKDCRISWAWAGNRDIDEEGSDNFAASTDDVGPDDYIKKVTTYRNKKFLRGVSVLYRCGKEVQHGTCGDASDTSESYELAENEHFIQGTVHESDKAQFDTPVVDSLRLFTNLGWRFWPKCEEENDGDSHSGLAPPGYVLKGFWTQHGEALDRLGLIWTKLPGGLDPDSSPFHYLWP
ncbi:hypothetical protein MMC19_000903, partial [Ptychographa xylographoides]|nr:hypothetical protein [Ptychographa xylographoides]